MPFFRGRHLKSLFFLQLLQILIKWDSESQPRGCQIAGGLKMDTKKIGLRIKGLRIERDLKQEKLAEILKIDRSTLSKIESGTNTPTTRILTELKQIFSVSIDWILFGTGSRNYIGTDKYNHDLEELLESISKDKTLKHAILSYFYTYKINKKKALEIPQETPIENKGTGGSHGE
jgi:transcriptional regulator with XRE-family HTH domain